MLTHAFNAMPGLHHRAPGPLGRPADGDRPGADRRWRARATMAVLLQRLAPEQTVLASDALAHGLADGEHRWDERVLPVETAPVAWRTAPWRA